MTVPEADDAQAAGKVGLAAQLKETKRLLDTVELCDNSTVAVVDE